ncbi:response regulator, partial [Acinetobacter baumannii]
MSTEGAVHLIDDDEGMRASLLFMLETAGFEPYAYASADSFLDAAGGAAGCVVTDVRMPGMNGIELIE